ncbi:uncharacterized protein si:ch211-106h4.12 isoform X2 [Carassius gibelio]|uniref:uncharacterized protein si:ch211-106h4.12 isoform X2 n=1 Tax=Carassius gibelio TaxID=101364 RepID=UPI002278DF0D|nr:uncharacterized protein si:ch211-106h4.12 isoform X2 [Carassius gibelio]
MKCTWTAESSRMKWNVCLGLLCLSLLIFSLHGEETENSREFHPNFNFEEPDFNQLEMYRVKRQTVFTEEKNPAKTLTVVNSKTKRKPLHPGSLSPLGDQIAEPVEHIYHRTKRQERGKKRKNYSGRLSMLARIEVTTAQLTDKMDTE